MVRWLKTGALLFAAFAAALVLTAPPDARALNPNPIGFNCGQVFGVNGPNGTGPYNVVGIQDSGKNYAGLQAPVSGLPACGAANNVPGAISTFAQAISPDGFVTGLYEDRFKVRHAYVMPISGGTPLTFDANTLSGDPNAYSTGPKGITVSTAGHIAWVVGYYFTTHTTHNFAVQVNTNTLTIVRGSWISFDISVAGGGSLARGVDGADPNTVIVGSYSGANGKQQGYVLTINGSTGLQTARTNQGNPPVTVVPTSFVATVTCQGAIGGVIHGISDNGRIVGSAFTSNTAGYAYYADGPWSANTINQPNCGQILPPSKNGQTWAAAISSDGAYILGEGGIATDWLYRVF